MNNISKLFISIAALTVVGCATISGSGTTQPLSVVALASDGSEVEGVKCDMSNDEGTWYVNTPGSTTVRRSNKDLQVICKKAGMDIGTASVVSRTKGNMWANIILGGGIGAIVDHNNGAGYEYPPLIKVFMGKTNQRIENKTEQVASNDQLTNANSSLDKAKKECEDLGFKPATEQYGSCVLRLNK